jgi:membrane protease YdiL (CAAX protease family)
MKTFDINDDQITFSRQLVYHFYLGVIITLFYIIAAPRIIHQGYPGLATLLMAELLILTPFGLMHLWLKERKLGGGWRLSHTVFLRKPLSLKQYLLWSLIGIGLCFLVYVPLYPLGISLREQVFYWLPEWYFNPGFGVQDTQLLAQVFLAGILIDGLIAPLVEELFFRGYLLPRMAYLKKWAPVVNGTLFGLYHFWQPHNLLAIIGVGIVLSYVVWKKQNVWLGVIIHCTLNVLGAVGGYLAVNSDVVIAR